MANLLGIWPNSGGRAQIPFRDPQTARRGLVRSWPSPLYTHGRSFVDEIPVKANLANRRNSCVLQPTPFLGLLSEPVVAANQLSEIALKKVRIGTGQIRVSHPTHGVRRGVQTG
jgi:hypothetical protein